MSNHKLIPRLNENLLQKKTTGDNKQTIHYKMKIQEMGTNKVGGNSKSPSISLFN
jgi:hypothetical protein